jgi:2-dehydropantoate 2-reductase
LKICIYGAGAIGGLLGAKLARAGTDVTLIARGPHLEALRTNGLRLLSEGEDFTVRPRATDRPAEVGPQDAVIVALKAQSVPAVVEHMQPLLGLDTSVVMAINGLPWWYFYKLEGPWRDRRLESVDPAGQQWRGIGPQRAIGCVVYAAAEVSEPGVIRHGVGDRFTLGEPDSSRSERIRVLAQAIVSAGFKSPVKDDIRIEIWVKLWGNVAFNPVSALTGATMRQICEDAGTLKLVRAMMTEAQAVAGKLGIVMPITLARRLEGAAAVGDHKTSMLQDLERRRPMEIDAVVAAVAEVGRMVGVATPAIDSVLALVSQRAKLLGLYPSPA